MLRAGSRLRQDICASSVAREVLICCGPCPRCCAVEIIHEALSSWKPLLFITGFSVLPLKADDTYLQLKKDLEYLDLKVSHSRGSRPLDTPLTESVRSIVAKPTPKTVQVWSDLDPSGDGCCPVRGAAFLTASGSVLGLL